MPRFNSHRATFVATTPQEREALLDPAATVYAYRADPTGKYGGKNGLETLPTPLSREDLYNTSLGLRAGMKYGLPPVSADEVATRALVEGRGDGGANWYNYKNPRAARMYGKVADDLGIPAEKRTHVSLGDRNTGAIYAAAVLNNSETAKRLGIPFDKVWNGTGPSSADYVQRMNAHRELNTARHPKNTALLDPIKRGLRGMPDPYLEALKREENDQVNPYDFHKRVIEELGDNSNAIRALRSMSDPALLHIYARNMARKETGVPPMPYGVYSENMASIPKAQARTEASVFGGIPAVEDAMRRALVPRPPSYVDRVKTALRDLFS